MARPAREDLEEERDRPPREPMIPRPAITLIALTLTGAMVWNVVNDGSPTQTLILGGVVSSILGVDWLVRWILR